MVRYLVTFQLKVNGNITHCRRGRSSHGFLGMLVVMWGGVGGHFEVLVPSPGVFVVLSGRVFPVHLCRRFVCRLHVLHYLCIVILWTTSFAAGIGTVSGTSIEVLSFSFLRNCFMLF